MQTPICEVCLKSKILCSACQEKLDKGFVSKTEVDVLRFLYNLSGDMKSLRDVRISRVVDCGVLLIIAGRGDAARLVGKGGSVVKALAKQFKKSIRVLEEATDFKEFIAELLSPSPVNGINTLYKDNEEIYKIRIPAVEKSHLIFTPENLSEIISNFYNLKAEIVFEG